MADGPCSCQGWDCFASNSSSLEWIIDGEILTQRAGYVN